MRFMVRSSQPKSRDEPPASNNDDSDSVMYMMRRNMHDVIKSLFPASKNPIFRDAIILHLYTVFSELRFGHVTRDFGLFQQ